MSIAIGQLGKLFAWASLALGFINKMDEGVLPM